MKHAAVVALIFVTSQAAAFENASFHLYTGASPLRKPSRYDALDSLEAQLGVAIPQRIAELDSSPKIYRTPQHPWLHRSWKLHSGMIGGRYLDNSFNALSGFRARHDYILKNPMSVIAADNGFFRGSSDARNTLSPAEKYDLLVGDLDSSLSRGMWRLGEEQLTRGGIADWMGLCDGSAGATAMTAEPVRNIVLKDARYGKDLKFFASDIKALASLLYSEFVVKVPIVGGRCDRENIGSIAPGVAPECESLNPAVWHRALVHLAGERGDVLFIDHTPSREVWNSPIIAYEFRYVSPVSGRETSKLQEALVPLAQVTNDSRRRLRNPETASLVGVSMTISIAGGNTSAVNGPQPAKAIRIHYRYDLEIDAEGTLVGGEWLSETHPDFMWALERGYEPRTIADDVIGVNEWSGSRVPENWLSAIRESSDKSQPLGAIIRQLIRLSAKP